MSRGRVQLASVGTQDEFLTGTPQVTYFLKKFKRHTKFALETLQSGFDKIPIEFGTTNRCIVPRKGDLIRHLYVKVELSDFNFPTIETTIDANGVNTNTIQVADATGITVGCYFAGNQGGTDYSLTKDTIKVTNVAGTLITLDTNVTVNLGSPAEFIQPIGYTDSIGHALIEHADLIIGGQTIQRITSEYMELFSEISISDSQQEGLELMVGKTGTKTGLGPASSFSGLTKDFYGNYPRIFIVSLPFYFFKSDSLSIPLSAIDKQEVEISLKFRKWEDLIVKLNTNNLTISDLEKVPTINDLTLMTEYVYLSNDELNYIRTTQIDYVITQLQLSRFVIDENETNKQVLLRFLNPVKELYFVIQNSNVVESNIISGNDWFNFNNPENVSAPLFEQLSNLKLDFNNETIIPKEIADAVYLRGVQPFLSHTRSPNRRFYVYSFALDPENHLPTGQVNMSRIINKLLTINTTSNTVQRNVRVYALNFNILRVQNGLAGIIFNDNNSV